MIAMLLATIVPTFGLLGLGWLCRRLRIWEPEAVRAFNGYAYYIALPALIFQAVFTLDLVHHATAADVRYLAALLFGHLAVAALAVALLSRAPREVRAVGPMLLTFGSTAYLGIPFATYAFGPTGTAYAALGSVMLVVVALLLSLVVLNRHGQRATRTATWHQLLDLPFLWVTLAGLLLPMIGVRTLPLFLDRTIDVVAGSAGPTALLALGAFQYGLNLRAIPWRWAAVLGVGKVLLPTATTTAALALLGLSGLHLAVGMSLAATSIAVTAFVLADEYQIGRPLVAGSLPISSAASLIALAGITALWTSTKVFS